MTGWERSQIHRTQIPATEGAEPGGRLSSGTILRCAAIRDTEEQYEQPAAAAVRQQDQGLS